MFYKEYISNISVLNFSSKLLLSMFYLFAVSTMSENFNSMFAVNGSIFRLHDDHSASDLHSTAV